jgi:wyosine [tRNA(Phe)-imidazoG37] synthetase (radical SAM superfamily)
MSAPEQTSCIYGPVYSRRLGRSLGVDLIPFKNCPYNCVYCQLGPTTNHTCERRDYIPTDRIIGELEATLSQTDTRCDYIGLAGSGEPTLHADIGNIIARIKEMTDIPVAVLTNGALLHDPAVADALSTADLVMPSLDAGSPGVFKQVNRPHPDITFERMVEGIASFTKFFQGALRLEVLLVAELNDSREEVARIADYASQIQPTCVDLNTVARPAGLAGVKPVPAERLEMLRTLFDVETWVVAEASPGAQANTPRTVSDEDILALLRRRPCTAHGVASGLAMAPNDAVKRLQTLHRNGDIRLLTRHGVLFYGCRRNA